MAEQPGKRRQQTIETEAGEVAAPADNVAPEDTRAANQEDVKALEASVSGSAPLERPWELIVNVLAAGMSSYYLYAALFGATRLEIYLGVYVGLTYALIFLVYPLKRGSLKFKPTILDVGLAVLSVAVVSYWVINYQALTYRAGSATTLDHTMSLLMIVLALEIGRRALRCRP